MSGDLLMQFAAAIADGKVKVIDLTQTLRPSTPVIQLPPPFAPSDPFSHRARSRNYDERGPAWYWNNLELRRAHRHAFRRAGPLGHRQGSTRTATPTPSRCSASSRRPCVIDCSKEAAADEKFLLRAGAYRGLGSEARPDPGRRLGADADRLVEAHRPGGVPQHEGGRPARAGAERRLRQLPGRGAQRQRLGRRGGRHRRRPGLRLRAGVPGAPPDARGQQVRPRQPHQSRPAAADRGGADRPRLLKIEKGSGSPLSGAGARAGRIHRPFNSAEAGTIANSSPLLPRTRES